MANPSQMENSSPLPVYNLPPYPPPRSLSQRVVPSSTTPGINPGINKYRYQPRYPYSGGVHGGQLIRIPIGFNDAPTMCCCGLGVAAKVLAIINLIFIVHTVWAGPFQILLVLDWGYKHAVLLFPQTLSFALFYFLNRLFPVDKNVENNEKFLMQVKGLTCMRPIIWLELPLFIANVIMLFYSILFLIAVFADSITIVPRESQIEYCNSYMRINFCNPEVILRTLHFLIVVAFVSCGALSGVVVFGVTAITALWGIYNGVIARDYMGALTRDNAPQARSQVGLAGGGGAEANG